MNMSQLKKSASFRSRIPVRRGLPQHRRYTSSKIATLNIGNNLRNRVYRAGRYSSSTSFSSGDESCESETIVNKARLSKNLQYYDFNKPNLMYRSADTISLDGQLDSISTYGSFSSTPSPVNQSKFFILYILVNILSPATHHAFFTLFLA